MTRRPVFLTVAILLISGSLQAVTIPFRGFQPSLRIAGIGVDRAGMSDTDLARRTDWMIQAQTFAILREPQAITGAERVTSPALAKLFADAEKKTGVSAKLLAAIAYLESMGDPYAESPTGPRGIMQMAESTAEDLGLQVKRETRLQPAPARPPYRTDVPLMPVSTVVQDDRLDPAKAIPAAALHLARLAREYKGLDWAIFAYHCGSGCIEEIRGVAHSEGVPLTVPRVFFSASPALHPALYSLIQKHMERDFSPTYWFRVQRAMQLLELYRLNPDLFKKAAAEYRPQTEGAGRLGHRLSVWLKPADYRYRTWTDIRRAEGQQLVPFLDDPMFFGVRLQPSPTGTREEFAQASPAALGTLLYIAFETRRVYEASNITKQPFVPLTVTALVRPSQSAPGNPSTAPAHGTGLVFDISTARLPAAEKACLSFVLDDLGWAGQVGFVEESANSQTLHIGPAPAARSFFARVFAEAAEQYFQTHWNPGRPPVCCDAVPSGDAPVNVPELPADVPLPT